MNFNFYQLIPVLEHYGLFFILANIVIILCTISVIFAILIDFIVYHKTKESKKKINSWVETGSMFLFFFLYYLLMYLNCGRINVESKSIISLFSVIGSMLLIVGCYVNIKGRLLLKHNWANQVIIYHNHTLVTKGVYKLVRHPLYASIIWMLLGGCFVYTNYIALTSVLVVFIPMMYYRAKQEERLLHSEFPEYISYKNKVWMLFPKLFKLW